MEKNKENPTQQQMMRDLTEKLMADMWFWSKPYKCWVGVADGKVKSPFTSRDDCAELLGRLTDEQQQSRVLDQLRHIVAVRYWTLLTATPAQISMAVRRATCQ